MTTIMTWDAFMSMKVQLTNQLRQLKEYIYTICRVAVREDYGW